MIADARARGFSDIGPAQPIQRGERIAERIATARGEGQRARLADPLNRIRLGAPRDALRRRYAAEWLRDLDAAAAGHRVERGEPVDGTRDPTALLPIERYLAARLQYRAAWQAIGPTYAGVVQWVVIGWGSLSGFSACNRMRDETAREWLLAGLDRIP